MIIEIIVGTLIAVNVCVFATWAIHKVVNFYYATEHYYG